eukprot:1176562-Prorocentrum_minimum.AAC.3
MGVKRASATPPEGWWARVVNMAIRPPRAKYQLTDLPGPKFSVGGRVFIRRNVTQHRPDNQSAMILNRRSSCNSHRRCTHYDYHHECQKLGDSGLFKRARLTEVLFRAIRTRNNTTFLLELWVTNKRGEVLVGSHYVLKNPPDQALAHHTVGTNTFIEFIYDALPCVIYLHGNSGCQWDACEILRLDDMYNARHSFTTYAQDGKSSHISTYACA